MSVENVSLFYEEIKRNKKLEAELNDIFKKMTEKMIPIIDEKIIDLAKKFGFDFSHEELKNYNQKNKLSENDLEKISGGISDYPGVISINITKLGKTLKIFPTSSGQNTYIFDGYVVSAETAQLLILYNK